MSPHHRQVAERLRQEREAERFSQYELATELGITRAALSNFELCQAPLSFVVGFELCRRLDLCPQWLATGVEPKRPFPPLQELGLQMEDVRKHMRRGVDYLTGYDGVLRRPVEEWVRQNPIEKLVTRQFRGDLEATVRRWSATELVAQLQERIAALRASDHKAMLNAHADIANAVLAEISARLELRRNSPRK